MTLLRLGGFCVMSLKFGDFLVTSCQAFNLNTANECAYILARVLWETRSDTINMVCIWNFIQTLIDQIRPSLWATKSLQMFVQLFDIVTLPKPRHPKDWRPAFLAMQLGFVAGALGLLGRDLLIFLTVDDWAPIIAMELAFGLVIGVGFFPSYRRFCF